MPVRSLQVPEMAKVIQLGFNKTGTSSLGAFFKKNDFKVISNVKHARIVYKNIQENLPAFSGIEDFDLAEDLEDHRQGIYISKYFRRIYEAYPDAKYILTTRCCESWLTSRLRHRAGKYVRRALRNLDIDTVDELLWHWRRDFYSYHSEVLSFFQGKSNLYVHSVNSLSVDSLLAFLGPEFVFKDKNYPHIVPGRGLGDVLNFDKSRD